MIRIDVNFLGRGKSHEKRAARRVDGLVGRNDGVPRGGVRWRRHRGHRVRRWFVGIGWNIWLDRHCRRDAKRRLGGYGRLRTKWGFGRFDRRRGRQRWLSGQRRLGGQRWARRALQGQRTWRPEPKTLRLTPRRTRAPPMLRHPTLLAPMTRLLIPFRPTRRTPAHVRTHGRRTAVAARRNNLKCDYGGNGDAGFDGCIVRSVSAQVFQWSCTNPDGGAPAECPKGRPPGTGTSCGDAGAGLKRRFGTTSVFCNEQAVPLRPTRGTASDG